LSGWTSSTLTPPLRSVDEFPRLCSCFPEIRVPWRGLGWLDTAGGCFWVRLFVRLLLGLAGRWQSVAAIRVPPPLAWTLRCESAKRHPWPGLHARPAVSLSGWRNELPAAQHGGFATFPLRGTTAPSLSAKHSSRNDSGQKLRQRGALSLRIRSSSSFLLFALRSLAGWFFPASDSRFWRSAVPLAWDLVSLCSVGGLFPWARHHAQEQR